MNAKWNDNVRGLLMFLSAGPVASALLHPNLSSESVDKSADLTLDNLKRVDDRVEDFEDFEDFEEYRAGIPRNDSEWSLGLSRREFRKKVEELGICDTGAIIVFTARVFTYTLISAWAIRKFLINRKTAVYR